MIVLFNRMNLDRLGGGTFDYCVKTRKKQFDVSLNEQSLIQFTMVAREERGCLEEYDLD